MTNPIQHPEPDAPAIAGELSEREARKRGLPLCVAPDSKDEVIWFENQIPADGMRGIMNIMGGKTAGETVRSVMGGGK